MRHRSKVTRRVGHPFLKNDTYVVTDSQNTDDGLLYL